LIRRPSYSKHDPLDRQKAGRKTRMRLKAGLTTLAVVAFSLSAAMPRVSAKSGAVAESGLVLTAQNFHIYTSGNLRFVVEVGSQSLIDEILGDPTAVFRISLGAHIKNGEQEVRRVIAKPESFVSTDSVDLTIREVKRRTDSQFELIALSTDIKSGTRRLEFSKTGVYPVKVEVVVNNVSRASLLAFVNRYDPSQTLKPMPVNTVIAIDAPITMQPDSSRLIDDATRKKIEKAIEVLQTNATRVTMQISPELLEGLSNSMNPEDQKLLVQLVAALDQAPLAQSTYVQFDPSKAAANNAGPQFTTLLERGRRTTRQIVLNSKIIDDLWLARTPLDQRGLDLLVKSGIRSILMLPSSSAALGEFDNAARPYRIASDNTDIALMVVDKSYVDQLSDPTNNSFLAATYLSAQIMAQRDQIETEGGTPALRRVVLTAQDGSVVNPQLINETLLILNRVPQQIALRTMVNLPAVRLDAYKPTLRTVDSTDFAQRVETLRVLQDDLKKMRGTISSDAKIWQVWDERLILMSSDSMNATQVEQFATATRAELKKIRQSVTIEEGTTFTLGSRESQLRLDLQNSSEFAMTVQVKVVSPKLQLGNDVATIEVPGGGSNELMIEVVALTNGLFPVEVRIFTADGLSQLGRKIEVSARVNALAGLGQVVTGVALLLLATWWVAHIRRKYRKKISKNHPVLRSKP